VLVSTEEIAKFRYENLETRPAIADMGIYLKTSGPGFFDADFYQRSHAPFTLTPPSSLIPALPLTTLPPVPVHWGWSAEDPVVRLVSMLKRLKHTVLLYRSLSLWPL